MTHFDNANPLRFPFPPTSNIVVTLVDKTKLRTFDDLTSFSFLKSNSDHGRLISWDSGGYDTFLDYLIKMEQRRNLLVPRRKVSYVKSRGVRVPIVVRLDQLDELEAWYPVVFEMKKHYMVCIENPENPFSS
jgi:hypothetical protein